MNTMGSFEVRNASTIFPVTPSLYLSDKLIELKATLT
jgi:hypothetical protein